ncbi:hypothetical protein FSP39_007295 [Pinctada imbricata]|uniref:Fibronectin type III-like domain-containing protein n=1 Tax=Pinctada imbricata TaxID=66713 RepID=A0AA88YHT6_PINIB|nr:hypothetical protein FSP39_007295 [Pinctada imbricata]
MVLQMSKAGAGKNGPAPAIPRLNISQTQWNAECLHGDVQAGNATSFPQALGMAASFDKSLIYKVAEATSIEVRAKHNDFVKRHNYSDHTGLTCWSPVINIMRHPLWGRNQETYGEDPYLSGKLSEYFVNGLQGNHPKYRRANAVCKHFDAYGGPDNWPLPRESFNAKVSEQDLRTTFLPQFKACIDAGAAGVMCSYNSVNGVPACANKKLLTDILRKEWKFNGFVVSDEGAVEFILLWHYYTKDEVSTALACVEAGLNLELSPPNFDYQIMSALTQAHTEGKISKDLLIERVRPLFDARMRLGEFDPKKDNPYNFLNLSVIQSSDHQKLSLHAAIQSFVLLKNMNHFLPIRKPLGTIAIVGPMANNTAELMGDYSPDVDPRFMTTPLSGLSLLNVKKVMYAPGCNKTRCDKYNKNNIQTTVQHADVTFLCLGTGPSLEAEESDRHHMTLPGKQVDMLNDVIKYSKGRIVLLLFSGGPLDINIAESSSKVAAIIHCFFPGQATGTALLYTVTMADSNSNPSARLPFTWYRNISQVKSITDYNMEGMTYRYFDSDPLYPFGYGLSYTTFQYSGLNISPPKVKAGGNVTVTFKLSNTGPVVGREVTEMYISWVNYTQSTPRYQLVGFDSSIVNKGQTLTVSLNITSSQMAVWTGSKGFQVVPGMLLTNSFNRYFHCVTQSKMDIYYLCGISLISISLCLLLSVCLLIGRSVRFIVCPPICIQL